MDVLIKLVGFLKINQILSLLLAKRHNAISDLFIIT